MTLDTLNTFTGVPHKLGKNQQSGEKCFGCPPQWGQADLLCEVVEDAAYALQGTLCSLPAQSLQPPPLQRRKHWVNKPTQSWLGELRREG